MKIKDDKIFGIEIPGAYERYSRGSKHNEEKELPSSKVITPATIPNPESYIILEGQKHGTYSYPDMLVSMDKSYFNQDWYSAQRTVHQNNECMLTPRQFVDFLNLLKSDRAYNGEGKPLPGSKLNSLLDEIIIVRSHWSAEWLARNYWRVEWLDACFSAQGETTKVTYHTIRGDGILEQVTEPLEDCLMNDKTPGIDLDDWLKKATYQGFPDKKTGSGSPDKKTGSGSLYYWYPRDERVAGFGASSVGAGLGCDGDPRNSGDPQNSYSTLGVRRARVKK